MLQGSGFKLQGSGFRIYPACATALLVVISAASTAEPL